MNGRTFARSARNHKNFYPITLATYPRDKQQGQRGRESRAMRKFVSVSGGKDSTATALLLWERKEDFELIWADTGAELPENYWIVPRLAQLVQKPLHVVSNGTFFQWLNHYNWLLPGKKIKWCTRILKQVPMDNFIKSLELPEPVIMNTGIRLDEPKRYHPLEYDNDLQITKYPLYEAGYGKKEVIDLCLKYDLFNPCYAWRSNVSCFCCPMQRKGDWHGLWQHHRELYAVAEEWERQSGLVNREMKSKDCTWNDDYSLEELRKWGGRDPSRPTKAQLKKRAYAIHNCNNGVLWENEELTGTEGRE